MQTKKEHGEHDESFSESITRPKPVSSLSRRRGETQATPILFKTRANEIVIWKKYYKKYRDNHLNNHKWFGFRIQNSLHSVKDYFEDEKK